MTLAAFLTVAALHLVAAISPGPAFVMTLRTAVTQGFRPSVGLAAGLGLGAVIWAVAALAGLALLAMAVGMAWWGWGRAVVSARDLCSVPFYVLAKLPVYAGYLFKRQKEWVRTDRK